MTDQNAKAEQLRGLHIPGNPLVFFNIWDAGSAKALATSGAKAIATSSWSVANANGFADGERIQLALAIDNLRRIVGATELPVTNRPREWLWRRARSGRRILVQSRKSKTEAGHCRTKVPFGVVEAINGNIKTLLRRGRGYKNLGYLLLKARRMAVTKTEFIVLQKAA